MRATFKFSGVASWKFITYMTDNSVVVFTSWKTGTSTMFSVHKISYFLEYIRGVSTPTNLTKTHNQKWARQGNLTSTHLQSDPQKVRQTGCQGNAKDRRLSLLEQRFLHYDILLNIVVDEDGDQESSGEQVGLGLSEGDLQEVWLGLGSNWLGSRSQWTLNGQPQ